MSSSSQFKYEIGLMKNVADRGNIETKFWGDFAVRKGYKIKKNVRDGKPIEGIVVQYVEKKTSFQDVDGRVYDTTAKISKYTSDQVKYSNDSYFELFDINPNVKNDSGGNVVGPGECEFDDSFQNGALVQYVLDVYQRGQNKGQPRIDPKTGLPVGLIPQVYPSTDANFNLYKTRGSIEMIGKNYFISTDDKAKYDRIRNLRWNSSEDTPANGLPYLPYSPDVLALINSSTESPVFVHKVVATWDESNDGLTRISSTSTTEQPSSSASSSSTRLRVSSPPPSSRQSSANPVYRAATPNTSSSSSSSSSPIITTTGHCVIPGCPNDGCIVYNGLCSYHYHEQQKQTQWKKGGKSVKNKKSKTYRKRKTYRKAKTYRKK